MRGGIRSPWALAGVFLLALTLLAVAVPAASAQCGGVDTAYPSHHPRGRRPPLAIGDSTMLLALQDLANIGYEANAHGCREWGEAMAILRARRAAHTLPHMVVIALGADGSVTHRDVGAALGVLCCTHLLVLVTNRELGGGSGSDAVTEREEVAKHRNRAKLLDWVRYSAGHGGWFQPDGLHLTDSGAVAFTHLLAMALPWAYPKRKPKRHASLVRPRRVDGAEHHHQPGAHRLRRRHRHRPAGGFGTAGRAGRCVDHAPGHGDTGARWRRLGPSGTHLAL